MASVPTSSVTPGQSPPPFLQSSKSDIQQKFMDLEWSQRHRFAEAAQSSHPPSQWARPSGGEIGDRNRYANIDPYANNRVRLRVPQGYSDYINASPISLKSAVGEKTINYIATQGPKEGSFAHLWRMVWHETDEVAVMVMLTQTHEAGREKCFQYFPPDMSDKILNINEHDEFQDQFHATVELIEIIKDDRTRSTIRKLQMTVGAESKIVWHYLFEGWPDFLVPEGEDRTALLELIKDTASKNANPANPRVVHCSAGVGRSGTFIALDYLLSELEDGALDDVTTDVDRIMDTVDNLRQQRMMMVQGESQYNFLYHVLKEKWLARNTSMAAT